LAIAAARRLVPITFMPKALAMRATSPPTAPRPRMPSVLPVSGCATVCTHLPALSLAAAIASGLAT
jgi:hypothetical protein